MLVNNFTLCLYCVNKYNSSVSKKWLVNLNNTFSKWSFGIFPCSNLSHITWIIKCIEDIFDYEMIYWKTKVKYWWKNASMKYTKDSICVDHRIATWQINVNKPLVTIQTRCLFNQEHRKISSIWSLHMAWDQAINMSLWEIAREGSGWVRVMAHPAQGKDILTH